MLKTFVKINSVANLSEARYCAGMGVELIGFMVSDISDKYVEPKKFDEIKGWLAGIEIVGELQQSADNQDIISILNDYDVEYLEIENIELLPSIKQGNKKNILKLAIENADLDEIIQKNAHNVEFFIIKGKELTQDIIQKLYKIAQSYAILLNFEVASHSINEVLEQIQPKGLAIDIRGFDDLRDILETLEEDF